MTSNSYARFGDENPLTADAIDPVSMCVGQTYFTKQGIPGANLQDDFCPRFMSQRCAVNFDNYCTEYLYTNKVDQGGFKHIDKNFLAEVAKKKYCRMDSGAPGASCATRCESFLPTGQSSVQICETIGAQNWLDTKEEYDLGGNFPQSARLNPISPLYLGYCPETCDAKGPMSADALGPNDPVLNLCIEHGSCSQILMDLAYNVVKNNIPVTNPAFQTIVNNAKLDRPVNPNVAAKIATQYGLPPQVALNVLKDATAGGVSNVIVAPIALPAPSRPALPVRQSIVVAPTQKKAMRIGDTSQTISSGAIMGLTVVGVAVVVAIILALLYMKKKR